jgi:hypothetical protein
MKWVRAEAKVKIVVLTAFSEREMKIHDTPEKKCCGGYVVTDASSSRHELMLLIRLQVESKESYPTLKQHMQS